MKQLLIIAMVMLTANFAEAQFLDKFKKKDEGPVEYSSLDDIAKNWQDGSYSARRENGGMWEPKGKQPVKFTKGADGKISAIDVDGRTFEADISKSSPFVMSYYNGNDMLYVTSTSIVQYRCPNGGKSVFPEWVWGEKKGVNAFKKEIESYRVYGKEQISSEKEAYAEKEAEEAKKREEERRAKYGLHDKDVAKIEIVNLEIPEKFGHFRNFDFDIKATLKDGTEITTGSGEGYRTDYKITYQNVTWDERGVIGHKFVKEDKIIVNIELANNSSIKTSKEVVVPYNEDVSFAYNGLTWSRGNGEGAKSYRIEVKQDKHAVSGKDVLLVHIYQGSNLLSEFKMGIDQTLYFYANGGNGGVDDGVGSDGGNGGNITLIKDPSVKYMNFEYSNKGGKGGKANNPSYNGTRGSDGTFKEESRALNW